MPSAVYPSLVVGIAAAVLLFQLGSGGLTLTSFFLKLFIYVSFALFCFLLGSFGLLVRKSPLKISSFDTRKRQSSKLADLFNKLMGRFCVPLLDSAQTRRVVVSLNVDKALKEAPLSGGTRFLFRSSIHVDQFNRPVKRVRERERGMMGAVSPVCRNDARLKNTKALVFADDGILACRLSSCKSGSD
ncbi:hypothetical protein DPX16_2631 [Anabarilius grahami]|uniref:Uncharacterized protein n=1 Tax=Anabarilius grahami TaxID=495550 RepID=A0A3N0Y4X6_ANAGA|nr:hypothetical protein DPX16_2631 [Anabarilius grahami]